MSKKIVAIGGGFNGRKKDDGTYSPYETGPMDCEIIRLTGKSNPNFLLIAHSKDTEEEQEEYFKTMYNIYAVKYGCDCRDLKSKDLNNKEKVNELIEWADIIYEGGGNTLDMIKLWKETCFDKVLRKAWENGKVMCGVSAGANCWFKECSSDSLQIKYGKDQPLIGGDCIGLVDGLFVPHCDEPGRYENVKDLLKTSNEIGLSISNCCALEIVDDKYRLITSEPVSHSIKPHGLKTYWEDGKYIEQLIDDSLEFKPLDELLSRNKKTFGNENYLNAKIKEVITMEQNSTKTNINWYPGHMSKTKREIIENLKLIDVVVEILDSRIPISSQNPDISDITKDKKKIIVLNKVDLADEKQNIKWVQYFNQKGQIAVLTDSNQGKGIQEVIREIEHIMKDEMEELGKKGRTGRKIRVMILGIPNVGKSSFINRIVKSDRLEVGNRPGVTRKKQWISVNEKIDLLDTPGVLWPKFESEQVALNLAFTGTIKDDVLEQTEITYELLKFLLFNYREKVSERYKISNEYIEEALSQDQPENFNIYEIMLEIGKKRGAIISGGNIDEEKTAKIILDDFRKGAFGRITIEKM